MTRAEHLQWAKNRALEYVERGDLDNAFSSLSSDLLKHPELQSAFQIQKVLGEQMLIAGLLNRPEQMRHWIEGFN